MIAPRYDITSLQLSASSGEDSVHSTVATIEMVLPEEPIVSDDPCRVQCEFELEISLRKQGDSEEEQEESSMGEIDVEFLVTAEGSEGEFDNYIETWNSRGYEALPSDFRYYLESGITSKVLAPISTLNDSLRGTVPSMAFTRALDNDDSKEESQDPSGE